MAAALIAILAVAAWLRWEYMQRVSLHVDEFTTLWAARQTLAHGAPIMPSGVLYTRGLLASYVEAAAVALGGDSYAVGRLPSLLFGVATILVVYVAGARGWRRSVGLLAALGLALLPEAIVWSGRARFYSQLQFFVLLSLWAAWEAIGEQDADAAAGRRWRWPLLYALFFVLALFSQEQTALLFPSILLAMLIWRGGRWLLSAPMLVANAMILIALVARFAIEIAGQPGYFETIQATRPYVGWIFDLRGAWLTYAPLFVAPDRLPWTLAGLFAAAIALGAAVSSATQARSLRRPQEFHRSTLYYALLFAFVLAVLFLLVGTSWREARYLYLVQPLWLLLGAAGFVWLVEQYVPRRAQGWALAGTAVALAAWMLPAALRVPQQQVEGFDRVLAQVRDQLQPGDVVLSPQPPACALVLGRPCDAYAIQRGYEEFVIQRDGEWVDRWSGARLLDTAQQLRETIAAAPRTWFVTDAFRLSTRYDGDFLKAVFDQFDPAIAEQGVLALRADGLRATPELTTSGTVTPPVRFGPLALVGWAHGDPNPGRPFDVELEWVGAEKVDQQINTSVRIVDADGTVYAQEDGPPARGIIPTTLLFDTPLPDAKRLTIPEDLPIGRRYRIDVAAYALDADGNAVPLGETYPIDWFFMGSTQRPLTPDVGAWQNGLALLGAWAEQGEEPVLVGYTDAATSLAPGRDLTLHLTWAATESISQSLTAFVHLIGPDGSVIAQDDHLPEAGYYPTSRWRMTEPVDGKFVLPIPSNLAPGDYRLVTGWYDATTGARVPAASGEDAIPLATWAE